MSSPDCRPFKINITQLSYLLPTDVVTLIPWYKYNKVSTVHWSVKLLEDDDNYTLAYTVYPLDSQKNVVIDEFQGRILVDMQGKQPWLNITDSKLFTLPWRFSVPMTDCDTFIAEDITPALWGRF